VRRAKHTPDGVVLRFSDIEADILVTLAEQFVQLLGDAEDPEDDPVLERLLPSAYRDDPENEAEFRRFTQTDLVDQKVAGALGIVEALGNRAADNSAEVTLSNAEAGSWLRSLNDLRLAVSVRLGIVDENYVPPDDDETFTVYIWLGMIQGALLDEVDR
jgi:hypothetical protein